MIEMSGFPDNQGRLFTKKCKYELVHGTCTRYVQQTLINFRLVILQRNAGYHNLVELQALRHVHGRYRYTLNEGRTVGRK